jgi:cell division control protein 7
VSPLIAAYRRNDQVTLVLPFFKHDKFKDYIAIMSLEQMRKYMKSLLEALAHLHANNIIHRDIKPGNYLANFQNSEFMLVDFGLAQYVRYFMFDI